MWLSCSVLFLLLSPFRYVVKDDNSGYDTEDCANAIDDDNDGLIDLNDPDCRCEIVDPASIIPNPSFEDQSCCPQDHSQMRCVKDWIQPSFGTSDYLHHCGYEYDAIDDNALDEFPDGDGAVGFLAGATPDGETHLEYVGTCLNRPLLEGSEYILKLYVGFITDEFSPPFRLAIYGSPSCDNLPFTEIEANCPLGYPDWYLIGQDFIGSDGESYVWREFSLAIQPNHDINALVIGADCVSGSREGIGYLLDNLRLNDESNFDFELVDQKHPCDPDFTFAVADNPSFSYQWYKSNIALIGETSAGLSQMYGEGTYQLRIVQNSNQECRIVENFEFEIPVIESEDFETICEGESLSYQGDLIEEPGLYEYILSSARGCDSIVRLLVQEEAPEIDSIDVQILPGSVYRFGDAAFSREGEHRIEMVSSNGCLQVTILNLEYFQVYIPNIFSPNQDGNNDHFEIYTSEEELVVKELSIYDRWGNLLFVGHRWDGRVENRIADSGVYIYVAVLVDSTGKELMISNDVVLIQ